MRHVVVSPMAGGSRHLASCLRQAQTQHYHVSGRWAGATWATSECAGGPGLEPGMQGRGEARGDGRLRGPTLEPPAGCPTQPLCSPPGSPLRLGACRQCRRWQGGGEGALTPEEGADFAGTQEQVLWHWVRYPAPGAASLQSQLHLPLVEPWGRHSPSASGSSPVLCKVNRVVGHCIAEPASTP